MEDDVVSNVAKQRTDLLDSGFPTVVLVVLILVAWTGWIVSHRMKGKVPAGAGRILSGLVRVVIGTVSLWSIWQLGARGLVLASSWPLWLNAFIGGAAIEAAIAAYGFERSTLAKRRSQLLLGLRLAAIGLVLLILVQPVFSRLEERKVDREVVVLIDDSESMQLVDRQLPAGERLEIAGFYGVEVDGRVDIGREIEGLRSLERVLQRQQGSLAMATGGAALPEAVRDGAVEAIGQAGEAVDGHLGVLEEVHGSGAVAGEAEKVMGEVLKTLRGKVGEGLRRTAGFVVEGKTAEAQAKLKEATLALQSAMERLPAAAEAIDEKTYEGLSDEVRSSVDEASERPRAAIARDVLMRPGESGSLAAQLEEKYKVRYVRFGRQAAELSPAQYLDSITESGGIDLGDVPADGGEFVREGAAFMSFVPRREGDSDGWKDIDFDEKRWRRILTPAGYSEDKEAREVFRGKLEGQMKRKSPGVYLRAGFEVEDAGRFGDVVLTIRYDDGFVAYLNGEEVARRNVEPGVPGRDSSATVDRDAEAVQTREKIVLGQGAQVLRTGKNVLAIHGMNVDKGDGDFFIDVALRGEGVESDSSREAPADGVAEDLEFRGLTDVVGALSHAAEKIAPDTLAGILLASDGQHNARGQVEDIARRLGVQGAPVGAVAIGSSVGPPDASILDLQVSESVYLGDKIVARADVKLDGLRGKAVRAVLVRDGEDLDEVEIRVPSDRYRTNLRFKHVPDEKGIYSYSVRLDPVEGELFRDNNDWHFDVAVTDDRKNVLLVDSFARWEFRYLRNLFYARDKSVHLQYVVLHPEAIEGQAPLPEVAASASRPFGEAEATGLPESKEEWLKFDAIILGDVPPAVFGSKEWEIIDECVRERGAMLVVVAGPRYMPHAHRDERFKELLPVIYAESADEQFSPPEMGYRLALTPEGRNSPIMRQAPSGLVNGQIWGGMPELRWRHAVSGVKEGAEVLAYAEAGGDGGSQRGRGEGFAGLFEQRQAQRQSALITTQRYAMGSVCALMFDRSWRFRYGVGDVYHHRFWGQLMRWGTGENLRVGTEFVRMGSDRLSYEPGESVRVVARVSTPDYRPVIDDDVRVAIYRGDERIAGTKLNYRPGSNGIYEVELEPFAEAGRYRMVLEGDEASDILEGDGVEELATEVLVESSKNTVELSELTVDRDFLNKTAALSDGRVVGVGAAVSLIDLFGEPSKVVDERLETTLWDTWPVLLLFFGVVTAEWIVRRRAGLV